jgi:ABC-type multidrug transport system fused ATPase/permease subunit
VEREAFARARKFLDYSPVAKWSALAAAVGTGVLYVALLVILGLFADLMVNRGQIPSFHDLSTGAQGAQESFFAGWESLEATPRQEYLRRLRLDEGKIKRLSTANPRTLPQPDLELLWRSQVCHQLQDQVSAAAASLVADALPGIPLSNFGVLSLVVRSQSRLYAPVLNWVARHNPWMWDNYNYYLPGLFVLAVALALVRAALRYALVVCAAKATIEAGTRLRRAVYHHTFRLGALAVRALGPSEAVGIFTRELEAVQNGLYAWLTIAFREPVKFFLVLAFAVVISPYLALAFLLFALLVWLVHEQLANTYRRQARGAMQKAAEQLALIQESLMLMRLVKVYLMELFNQSRVERQLASYAAAQMKRHLGEIHRPALTFLGTVAAAILLGASGLIVLEGRLGIATAITLATALVSLYLPAVTWLEYVPVRRRARASAVALFEFLDRKGDVGQMVGAEFLPPLARQLEFDDVSLREPGNQRMLLEGVSLTIEAGQRVALVGADELEKHALVYLIPRFLDPTSGEIRIDNHNLRWVTLDSLRAQTALVLQHNLVFNDTVANNIGCGDSSFTLPQIIEACKIAHAHQFIQKLPRGYETLIGEMGHTLEIGHQFLIALARAILRDPALLIVEEPVETLEDDIKALLDDTFDRVLPGRTTIFLPHRISTIRSCDRIFLLHKGRVQATGDHRELLTQNELYRHLHYLEFHELAEQV